MFARLFRTPPSVDRATADGPIRFIDAATLRGWMSSGEAVVIDVREPPEIAQERIPGAVAHPLSRFDPSALPAVAPGQRLVIHCRSGSRCGMAAARLVAAGHDGPIHRLEGGILGWKAAGGPTVGG